MKPIINKSILILALSTISLVAIFACSEEEHISLNQKTFGVTLEDENTITELPIGQSDSEFSTRLTLKAPENGQSVDKIDVHIKFLDLVNEGSDKTSEETLFKTIEPSDFINNIGEDSRPKIDFAITLLELISNTGIVNNDVDGSDEFEIKFTVVLNNERKFSKVFTTKIVCPPTTPPTPGIWQLELRERWGDSWDGGALVISIDGVVSEYNSTLTLETVTFNVPAGTSSMSVGYKGGNWDNENGFKITNPDGKVVINIPIGGIGRGSVPFGTIAPQIVDYCAF